MIPKRDMDRLREERDNRPLADMGIIKKWERIGGAATLRGGVDMTKPLTIAERSVTGRSAVDFGKGNEQSAPAGEQQTKQNDKMLPGLDPRPAKLTECQ